MRITPLSAAGYFLAFAFCAKAVAVYEGMHPAEDALLRVEGDVATIRLGGNGHSTTLEIQSGDELFSCSSYFGKVWTGMDQIRPGDPVEVLLERNKLNRNEMVTGKRYYIWRLIHEDRTLIEYADVARLVSENEAMIDWYINLWIAVAVVLLAIVYARRPLPLDRP
jgi:hypothetical protein